MEISLKRYSTIKPRMTFYDVEAMAIISKFNHHLEHRSRAEAGQAARRLVQLAQSCSNDDEKQKFLIAAGASLIARNKYQGLLYTQDKTASARIDKDVESICRKVINDIHDLLFEYMPLERKIQFLDLYIDTKFVMTQLASIHCNLSNERNTLDAMEEKISNFLHFYSPALSASQYDYSRDALNLTRVLISLRHVEVSLALGKLDHAVDVMEHAYKILRHVKDISAFDTATQTLVVTSMDETRKRLNAQQNYQGSPNLNI